MTQTIYAPDQYYHIYNRGVNRQPIFFTQHNWTFFLQRINEYFTSDKAIIIAYCLMPNHYHLLAGVPEMSALGELFRRAHGRTAHDWNTDDGALGRRVWYRYSDRAMRSEAHFYAALNYVHANPVKHGWVASPYAWEESSVHWYREHHGSPWLQDLWRLYPVREYGRGWDD